MFKINEIAKAICTIKAGRIKEITSGLPYSARI
jgi:hypothetical protein